MEKRGMPRSKKEVHGVRLFVTTLTQINYSQNRSLSGHPLARTGVRFWTPPSGGDPVYCFR